MLFINCCVPECKRTRKRDVTLLISFCLLLANPSYAHLVPNNWIRWYKVCMGVIVTRYANSCIVDGPWIDMLLGFRHLLLGLCLCVYVFFILCSDSLYLFWLETMCFKHRQCAFCVIVHHDKYWTGIVAFLWLSGQIKQLLSSIAWFWDLVYLVAHYKPQYPLFLFF